MDGASGWASRPRVLLPGPLAGVGRKKGPRRREIRLAERNDELWAGGLRQGTLPDRVERNEDDFSLRLGMAGKRQVFGCDL